MPKENDPLSFKGIDLLYRKVKVVIKDKEGNEQLVEDYSIEKINLTTDNPPKVELIGTDGNGKMRSVMIQDIVSLTFLNKAEEAQLMAIHKSISVYIDYIEKYENSHQLLKESMVELLSYREELLDEYPYLIEKYKRDIDTATVKVLHCK